MPRKRHRSTQLHNSLVSIQSLDWAIRHVLRHGDTDIFPVPFEYLVIERSWNRIRDLLAKTQFGSAPLRSHITLAVPKMTLGFRVAHQLDPLDSLLYAAQVFEMGDAIEQERAESNVACSYRFNPTSEGDFFPKDNGWQAYSANSRLLSSQNSHVLYVDITDFYNQIYHHRLVGSLENCGISTARAVNVENFLGRFGAKQSRGIPVGPSASHLLAECCLNDVDAYLKESNIPFVRYSDDFRVFSDRKTLTGVLAGLTKLLYSNHRLAVQASKTTILETSSFVTEFLEDPGRKFEQETDRRLEQLAEYLSDLSEPSRYGSLSIDDLSLDDWPQEIDEVLKDSFDEALNSTPVKLGMLRHLLRKAKACGSPALISLVQDHFKKLIPILSDVCKYLHKVLPREDIDGSSLGETMIRAVKDSDYASCGYVGMWVLDLLTGHPELLPFDRAINFAAEYNDELGLRPQALLARAHSMSYWIRNRKEDLMNMKPRDRRALIWAASILPESEKKAWLRVEKQIPDELDAAVAEFVRNGW